MKNVDLKKVRETAEDYYRRGDFYCSEAVVKTIKDTFELDFSDEVIKLASGFPVGIGGSGCTCGAVSGGVMALGMVFGRANPQDPKVMKTMKLSAELHERFREKRKFVCCKILTKGMDFGKKEHLEQCITITGEVSEIVADIIAREL
ncbi:C-GCAxxG-C-C family protein [uncultured Clostridium sp.]|jgi:C_GCAxxG_C_C family probable redox protein|uniref:C-GCAxxG-C-C family protein n=1 Tax=uncultured Clostridium sp. TaxID=59620 RepID=UPI0026046914|nr:C-GCAxxG-C-C family protein [uncultured Clostridium sp.]